MKITKITTYILKVNLGKTKFYSSQCEFPERNSLLVEIETDIGITGWGEGGQYGPPEPVATCIDYVLGPSIIGKDPMEYQKIWETSYAKTRDYGQKGSYIEAMSAVDIALWDILGKVLHQPIYKLLGGAFRKKISAYATGCYYRDDNFYNVDKYVKMAGDEARNYADSGFTMLKAKIGLLDIHDDLRRVQAIKDNFISDGSILLDCNHAYNFHTAKLMCKELERLDIRWIEEPVVPEDYENYAKLRTMTSIPVAAGECEYTRYGFRELLARGCADIIQPDVCVTGGITEFLHINAIAKAFNTPVIPHVWGSAVALAAALHVTATLPPTPHTANPVSLQNQPVIEYDRNHNPLRDDLIKNPIKYEDGFIYVPEEEGLGIEIDRDIITKYEVK